MPHSRSVRAPLEVLHAPTLRLLIKLNLRCRGGLQQPDDSSIRWDLRVLAEAPSPKPQRLGLYLGKLLDAASGFSEGPAGRTGRSCSQLRARNLTDVSSLQASDIEHVDVLPPPLSATGAWLSGIAVSGAVAGESEVRLCAPHRNEDPMARPVWRAFEQRLRRLALWPRMVWRVRCGGEANW